MVRAKHPTASRQDDQGISSWADSPLARVGAQVLMQSCIVHY
jgi:hypothetical protein